MLNKIVVCYCKDKENNGIEDRIQEQITLEQLILYKGDSLEKGLVLSINVAGAIEYPC